MLAISVLNGEVDECVKAKDILDDGTDGSMTKANEDLFDPAFGLASVESTEVHHDA